MDDEINRLSDERAQRAAEQVRAHRTKVLYKGGFPMEDAVRLAKDAQVDVHRAVEMIEQGCDPKLAVEILT